MGMLTAALPSIEAMTLKKRTLSWLAVLFLTGVGILASSQQVLTRTSEVARALNPVLSSYEVLRFEPGEIERQVRTTGELRLQFDGTDFHFNLKPHSLRAPNYRAVETGPGGVRRTLPPQPVRTYKGTLAGREDSQGRFNLTGRGIEGVVFAPEGLYYVEPLRNYLPGTVAGDLVVYRQSDIKPSEDFKCGVSLPKRLERTVARVRAQTESDSPTNYVFDMATEADYEYVQALGGSAEANSEIEGILNHVEAVFQSELLLQLQISFQHTWDTAADPYTATTLSNLRKEFRDYWNANFAADRDYHLAHMWTDRERDDATSIRGNASNSVVCRIPSHSYGVTARNDSISLKYRTPTHEIAHNFGAGHTWSRVPPLPSCARTIMGRSGAYTFCQYSRQDIANYVADYNDCLDTQTITLQPPSDLSATAASASAISLAWEDNSANETGFIVQRRRTGSGTWEQIGTTEADIEALSNDGLFSEYPYIYRVRAFNDSESSAYSSDAEATTLAGPPNATEWRIHTVAGGNIGDNGPATGALLSDPFDVAVDTSGNLYIADDQNNRIRRVDSSGNITTVAGTGVSGYGGDGGPATEAVLNSPVGVAVDTSGNLYIADSGNHRIQRVDTMGTITTVAGTGEQGESGDGGPATAALLSDPFDVAVDTSGNLYIADTRNDKIRRVDTMGIITTVAGTGAGGYFGDGGLATNAWVYRPRGVAVDSSGNIYIADTLNDRVRQVDTMGIITTVAGTGESGYGGDGGLATAAVLYFPTRVVVDSSGKLYIADTNNSRIRRVDTSGNITTVAGTGEKRLQRGRGVGDYGKAGCAPRGGAGQFGKPLHYR